MDKADVMPPNGDAVRAVLWCWTSDETERSRKIFLPLRKFSFRDGKLAP